MPDRLSRGEADIGSTADAPEHACELHKKQIERLQHENRRCREFMANVLHDIRSALSAVMGYLETPLVKTDVSAEMHRQHLQIAHKQTVRLSALVNELFTLSTLDDIDKPNLRERFSLSELVMDTAIAFNLQADEKKIRLTLDGGAAPAFTMGNIAQIQRVLENLISNAIRFTPESGAVAISVIPGSDAVTVAIADSGAGIPEECLPRVFDRFYKAHPDNETDAESAGLGLAIVKQILDLHDSRISVFSKVGAGTRFEFELPLINEAD